MGAHWFGLAVALMLSTTCGFAPAARAQGIGNCAWNRAIQGGERDAFLAAFKQGQQVGMTQLAADDPRLMQYVAQCARRDNLPRLWAQAAIGSVALQDGHAGTLQTSSRISRQALDMSWAQAPAPALDCLRANAAKVFGVNGLSCSDPGAPLWFARHFGISPSSDRVGVAAVLSFVNAKAQEEWAESLIARAAQRPTLRQ